MDIFLEMEAPEDLCQHLFLSFVRPTQVNDGEGQVSNVTYMNSKHLPQHVQEQYIEIQLKPNCFIGVKNEIDEFFYKKV